MDRGPFSFGSRLVLAHAHGVPRWRAGSHCGRSRRHPGWRSAWLVRGGGPGGEASQAELGFKWASWVSHSGNPCASGGSGGRPAARISVCTLAGSPRSALLAERTPRPSGCRQDTEEWGDQDPFAVALLTNDPDHRAATDTAMKGGTHPCWNQSLHLPVTVPGGSMLLRCCPTPHPLDHMRVTI